MGDLLYLIIGIAVLGVLLVVGLLARTRSGRAAPPADATDVIATPVETAPEELDTAPVEAPVETPVAPALEKPEGTASRLQRLRARLAGSQPLQPGGGALRLLEGRGNRSLDRRLDGGGVELLGGRLDRRRDDVGGVGRRGSPTGTRPCEESDDQEHAEDSDADDQVEEVTHGASSNHAG